MDGVKDHVLAIPAPRVAGNDITAAANHNLVDIAAKPYIPVAIGDRNRIIIGLVAHQGLRVHLAGGLITGVKRRRRQIHHRLEITLQALPDAVAMPAQDIRLPLTALLFQPEIECLPCCKPGDTRRVCNPAPPDGSPDDQGGSA